jgi:hypothetical protein
MSQAIKDFVRGMGQALDMGGTMADIRQPSAVRRSDAASLRGDWESVGGYMKWAMKKSASQHSKKAFKNG